MNKFSLLSVNLELLFNLGVKNTFYEEINKFIQNDRRIKFFLTTYMHIITPNFQNHKTSLVIGKGKLWTGKLKVQ